jgi:hypothetical protein
VSVKVGEQIAAIPQREGCEEPLAEYCVGLGVDEMAEEIRMTFWGPSLTRRHADTGLNGK